jgi:predicted nucleotidyltransferase
MLLRLDVALVENLRSSCYYRWSTCGSYGPYLDQLWYAPAVDVARPILDVVPGVRGEILATLARLSAPSTGRQIERAAGQPHSSTVRVLDDLVDAGLVVRTIIGRDNTYRLNPDHVAAPAILALASLRGELVNRLCTTLSEHRDVVAAWLFGSAARGDGNRRSDIDILIVHNVSEPGVVASKLAALGKAWTGNPVQVVEHSIDTFTALVDERNPLINAIRRDGIALTEQSDAWLSAAVA